MAEFERRRPSLDSSGRGAGTYMRPLWLLLRSKQSDDKWGPKLRGAFRSVIANRQWTQKHCVRAGFATDTRCLFCRADFGGSNQGGGGGGTHWDAQAQALVLPQACIKESRGGSDFDDAEGGGGNGQSW